jgi:hypothetical protein
MRNVADVSAEIAANGLHFTSDMWLFAAYMHAEELLDAVQRIIHDKQPLTSSYVAYADHVYDEHNKMITADPKLSAMDYMMTMASLSQSKHQITHALHSMFDLVLGIYLKSTNQSPDTKYPCVIPHELEDMRLTRPWQINRDTFRRIMTVDPWLSWTERMRAQYQRNMFVIQKTDLGRFFNYMGKHEDLFIEELVERIPIISAERKSARKAIKRAVKLHDRIHGMQDVRTFISGKPLRIEGKRFNYNLKMNHNGLFEGMIHRNTKVAPCHMDVYDKMDNHMCSVCLYFTDVSLLDHILNVKLFARNEETELDMIRAFHVMTATVAFYADPILPDIKGIHDPVTAPLTVVENITLHSVHSHRWALRRMLYQPLMKAARAAFDEVVPLPEHYRTWLVQGSRYSVWDYIAGEVEAVAWLDKMQVHP